MATTRDRYLGKSYVGAADLRFERAVDAEIDAERTDGYPYGCACGESYLTEEYAWACRKCLRYLSTEDYAARVVYGPGGQVLR